MNKFKQHFHLWIHNCYRYSPLHGACSELLDCQLFLIYIEPWEASPLVLCTLCHLQCRCHCFEMLPWVAAFWDKLANHGVLFFCLGGPLKTSFLWGLTGDTGSFAICVGLFWGVGHCSELLLLGLGLGDLFSFWGLSKKLVISTMLLSVSVSRSSRVWVFFFGYGELYLGSKSKFWATLVSHDVALCSSSLISSSTLKFFSEGGVMDSIGGIFSLSESRHSGSSKYFGLYSCSVGLGHGPESEVTLISLFLGVKTPGSFGEIVSLLWVFTQTQTHKENN